MSEKIEKVELDAEALKTITDTVVAGLGDTVKETVKSEVAEATKGLAEKVVKKNVASKGVS